VISDYLDSLVGALSFDRPLSGRVRQEVEDHLREAVAADPAGDGPEAERRAIANFGDPRVIAAEFAMVSLAKQTRRVGAAIILVIAGVRIFRLRAAGLWISGLLRIPRLLQSSGLWIPRLLGTASLSLRGLRIAKQLGIPLLRTPGLCAAKRLGAARLSPCSGQWISEPAALFSVLRFRLRKSGRWLFRRSPFGELVAWGRVRDRAC